MKFRRFLKYVCLLPAVICCACSVYKGEKNEAALPAEAYKTFTDDGAWCWFSDPRAIYKEGKFRRTYSGWVDSTGNVVVSYYDHDTDTIVARVLQRGFEKDDHDNPSFFMGADGRLMVFYSKHATGNSPIFFSKAKHPEDITAWEPAQMLRLNDTIAYEGYSNTYTYTNVVQLSAEQNRMFLFWRGADFKPNVSVSDNGGQRWEEGRILVLPERIYRDRRPYMKVASNNRDVIHFAFTDGHPHVEPTNSIYYMKYRDGALYKASGEKIIDWSALPVQPRQCDVVYDAVASQAKAWIWDVAENAEGNPVMVFATFPSDSNHVYHYSIYDHGTWNTYKLTEAGPWFPDTPQGTREREPNYSGGIVLDHNDPSTVYLSREKNGVFEIERWTTADKGKNWSVREITRDSRNNNVRPFVIRNHPGDSPAVLWMNVQKYVHYTDYRSGIRMSVMKD